MKSLTTLKLMHIKRDSFVIKKSTIYKSFYFTHHKKTQTQINCIKLFSDECNYH